MFAAGLFRSIHNASEWERQNIAPKYREDRWENSTQGMRMRSKVEHRCGPIPSEAWMDLQPGMLQPVLNGFDSDLALKRCVQRVFDEEHWTLAPSVSAPG